MRAAQNAISGFSAIGAWGRTLGDEGVTEHGAEDRQEAPHGGVAGPPCPYRAIFISDVHLGTPGCQADALLDFLRSHPSDCLYLVGDIVDGWQLRRRWYWPQSHNDVVQKL